jgi:hypothetical protein
VKVNIPYDVSDYIDDIRLHTELKEKILFIDEFEKAEGEFP